MSYRSGLAGLLAWIGGVAVAATFGETRPALDAVVIERMKAHAVPGASIALIENGKLGYARQYGIADTETASPVTERTLFEAASLSKPLFAFFALTYVADGKLDLDRPLHEYFPTPALAHDERYRAMTARHVLSHRSGLPNWRPTTGDTSLRLVFAPGTGFEYSGEGYQYLAQVLSAIANVDAAGLEALFQERVAKPLALRHTHFVVPSEVRSRKAAPHDKGRRIAPEPPRDKGFGAAYAVVTDTVDYATWAIAVLDRKLLAPQVREAFLQPQRASIPPNHPQRALGLRDWALGFSIFDTPTGIRYVHGGNNVGYTSVVVLDVERRSGFVVLTNANQAADFMIDLFNQLQQPPAKN
jgi:CubicO group peptidase (beta-lactamase class C family)